MLRDPIRIADTRACLMKAEMDLKAAAPELTAAPPFTGHAVFHAQQAAEKALKAPPSLRANVFAADEILEFREENLVKAAAAIAACPRQATVQRLGAASVVVRPCWRWQRPRRRTSPNQRPQMVRRQSVRTCRVAIRSAAARVEDDAAILVPTFS